MSFLTPLYKLLADESLVTEDIHSLKKIDFSFNPPFGWEEKIALVQNHYLSTRSGSPKKLGETLRFMKNIIVAKEIIDEAHWDALCWASVNLLELYLLLKDEMVTEIFANKLENWLVVTHRREGRCITNLKFSQELWKSLKTRSEYDTGLSLTPQSPALKVGYSTDLGELRVSLQDAPLSVDGPILTLRRLPPQPISLDTLIEDKFINEKWADFLVKALRQRKNVIIAGEPGSGKTTLANALLELVNPKWRVIVMEDAGEIKLSKEKFPLLIRMQLPQIGGDDRFVLRINEISRLLHRSPDYVFLGEIQNAEDTRVSFEAFSAGVRGLATTHARTLEGLLTRWRSSHGLSEELISTIDYVVLTERVFEASRFRLSVKELYLQDNSQFEVLQ